MWHSQNLGVAFTYGLRYNDNGLWRKIGKLWDEYKRMLHMNQNLLILGAGIYGLVAKEIAESMNCFSRIAFVDDAATKAADGSHVIGTSKDLSSLSKEYQYAVVAIGNAAVRLSLLKRIGEETQLNIATLISPYAYTSPSAKLGAGCIVEPMAVIHAGCVIEDGCIISAGAVVNHGSCCEKAVHVDCNATVKGFATVPAGTKVNSGTVFA